MTQLKKLNNIMPLFRKSFINPASIILKGSTKSISIIPKKRKDFTSFITKDIFLVLSFFSFNSYDFNFPLLNHIFIIVAQPRLFI